MYQQKKQTLNLTTMTITSTQNAELDSLKNSIENIESKIANAQCDMELANDLEDYKKASEIEKAINYGLNEIKQLVSHQAQSMKLSYNTILDLTFDREYTLQNM